MNTDRRITTVYQRSPRIRIDNSPKIVFFSDCHRGDGSAADNFVKNRILVHAALSYYYRQGYTYIELGDGDELWEQRRIQPIIEANLDIFRLLSKFYEQDRLYMLFGNHDRTKTKEKEMQALAGYYDYRRNCRITLFPNLIIHEGLVLKRSGAKDILLIHGHQADFLNDQLASLSRFLVRYFWKPMELLGMLNPYQRSITCHECENKIEKKLKEWTLAHKCAIIAGHTHRPFLPKEDEPPYYNDGSCVHPRHITAIEMTDSTISLIKWTYRTHKEGTVYVSRDIIATNNTP